MALDPAGAGQGLADALTRRAAWPMRARLWPLLAVTADGGALYACALLAAAGPGRPDVEDLITAAREAMLTGLPGGSLAVLPVEQAAFENARADAEAAGAAPITTAPETSSP